VNGVFPTFSPRHHRQYVGVKGSRWKPARQTNRASPGTFRIVAVQDSAGMLARNSWQSRGSWVRAPLLHRNVQVKSGASLLLVQIWVRLTPTMFSYEI
jgi:hypothetical protein